jgi:diguanylate cyclase (GGDEF)-like protein/PAS domain S-box-containing protein
MNIRQSLHFDRIASRAQESYVLFPAFAVLLLIFIWSWCLHVIRVEGAAIEKKTSDSAYELVETYEAQMIRNLGSIKQTLGTVKYAYEASASPATLTLLRERGLLPPSILFNVSIFDNHGNPVAGTSLVPLPPISKQPYFLEHLANDARVPIVQRVALGPEDVRVLFSRRLNTKNGGFIGVVQISVDPAYFTSGYEAARLGKKGVLGLLNDDGVFLVRRTGDVTSVDGVAHPIAAISQLEKTSVVLETHEWDGEQRYAGVRPLFGFPLSVLVGLSKAERFEEFKSRERNYLFWAALASLFLALVASILSRYAWELSESRRRTRKDQETYYAASEASMDAVFVLRSVFDRSGEIIDFTLESVNNRAAALFRLPKETMLGRKLSQVVPKVHENSMFKDLVEVAKTGETHELEWKNDLPMLRAVWLHRQVVRVEDGVIVIMRDISERKQAEARIVHMAHHDSLTGLPNRTLLEDRIQQAILQAQRSGHSVMVAFVDLDNFKFINDCLGHAIGDELLKAIAKRIRQNLRQTDTIVRLGGDEFVIVLSGQQAHSDVLASTFHKIRTTIADPIFLAENKIEVTASMGVAVYPEDGVDSATLLMHADAAMYQAKAHGRNNCQFFTDELDHRIREKMALQDGLRVALARDEFLLLYQPQVELHLGRIVGVEALIRWRHPVRGVVSTQEFIALAEETGLIGPIGEWVLRTACRQNKAWQDAGLPALTIAVNVSARQFKDNSLLTQVDLALKESGLESRYLCIEVTESMLMQNPSRAIATMEKLQAMGVSLSIDDFGTGYSNLSALKSFPITTLKLDQSFIRTVPSNLDDCAIAKTVISLGRQMDMHILAEGIETEGQLAFLRENGCHEGQGYLLCPPSTAEEVAQLLQSAEGLFAGKAPETV